MNISKKSELATHEALKNSDKKKLSVDARIIIALIRKQPQKRVELCKNAGVHPSSFSRVRRLLTNRGIIERTVRGYKLWYYIEPTSSWDRLLLDFEQVGTNLVEIDTEKASYAGREAETGWRVFNYDTKRSIKGIIVLKGSIGLVAKARSAGIYFRDEYDGVVLTSEGIGWKDRLRWEGRIFEIGDVEERFDGYDSVGYYVGKLIKLLPSGKENAVASSPREIVSGRSQIRSFLTSHLSGDNITKDDDSTKAVSCVMYTNPNYSVLKEFHAIDNPVDGIFAVGVSETSPLFSADQTIYGYHERVPISIYTVDKIEVSGGKLLGKMKAELMRVCETNLIDDKHRGRLEKRHDRRERHGSTILYSTEFVLDYKRSANR